MPASTHGHVRAWLGRNLRVANHRPLMAPDTRSGSPPHRRGGQPKVPATKYGQAVPDHAIIQLPAWKRRHNEGMSAAPRFEPRYTVEDYRHWDQGVGWYVLVDPDAGRVEVLESVDTDGGVMWRPRHSMAAVEMTICDRCRLVVSLESLAGRDF